MSISRHRHDQPSSQLCNADDGATFPTLQAGQDSNPVVRLRVPFLKSESLLIPRPPAVREAPQNCVSQHSAFLNQGFLSRTRR